MAPPLPQAPPLRTAAAALVHDAQVWVAAAARGAQFALVAVGGAVRAADLKARWKPRAVGRALAARTAPQHAAGLAWAALHALARICGQRTHTCGLGRVAEAGGPQSPPRPRPLFRGIEAGPE